MLKMCFDHSTVLRYTMYFCGMILKMCSVVCFAIVDAIKCPLITTGEVWLLNGNIFQYIVSVQKWFFEYWWGQGKF